MFRQTDLTFTKHTRVTARSDFQIGLNILNVFNQPNFVPVGQVGTATSINSSSATNVATNYEVTALTGTNTSRLIEIVTRFTW